MYGWKGGWLDNCLKEMSNAKFKFLKIIYKTLHDLNS